MTLEQLKKLCDEAEPGPWKPGLGMKVYPKGTTFELTDPRCIGPYMLQPEADFISAARTYMPMLIAVAEAASSLVCNLETEAECDACDNNYANATDLAEALTALKDAK